VGRPTAFAADAPLPDDDLTPGSRKRKSRSRIEHLYVDLPSIADLPCGRALANLKLDIQLAGALNAEAAKDTSLVLPLPFLFSRPIDEPQVSQMRVQRDGPRPARLRGPASRVMRMHSADSNGRRNTRRLEVAMNVVRRRSARSGRAPLPSPGRPSVAGRNEQNEFWRAIAAGLSSEDAALEAGLSQPVGSRLFRKAGGMPPAMFRSSAKALSGRYLSLVEREEIALLKVQGHSMQEIGRRLGRAASTVSRELRRNAATRGGGLEYRATTAQWHAERSARRPKPTKLALNATLRTYVEERLAGGVVAPSGAPVPGPAVPWKGRRHGPRKDRRWAKAWSPEQIARRLPIDFPDDKAMRISHEAIYQALFVQGRGALRRELTACLRTGRVLRMPKARVRKRGKGLSRRRS
jgi:hypothetical protein